MRFILTGFVLLLSISAFSQQLYSRAFGERTNPAILFLHGGPGYNCSTFEVTTAQTLAAAGFYVIVYDRRGEGRSDYSEAKYTFKQSFKDIKSLLKAYEVDEVALIGHSFGGILATEFALKNKDLVKNVVLVGAPVSLQESFKTIIDSSRQIYTDTYDKVNMRYLNKLDNMDSTSLDYAVYCFSHAMQNGFYSTKEQTAEAKAIFEQFKSDSTLINFAAKMTQEATYGFWKNESYTTLDLSTKIKELKAIGIPVYGLYGKEDGLYSEQQIMDLSELIGSENLKYLDQCSHSVYIDQQATFIEALKLWLLNN